MKKLRKFLSEKKYLLLASCSIILFSFGIFFLLDSSLPRYSVSYRLTPELGEAVVISYSAPLTEDKAVQGFSIEPSVEGKPHFLAEYYELHFVPDEGFTPGKTYTIRAYGRNTSLLFAAFLTPQKFTFQSKELPTKLLVRAEQDSTIYYITESGLKRPFPNMEVFYSYPDNREEDIKTVDAHTLSLYPDNTLIHLHNDPRVYKLENGQKRLVQNAHTFNALGLEWNGIAPVNQIQFDSYPTGSPLNIAIPPSQAEKGGKFIEVNLEEMKIKLWEDGGLAQVFDVAGKGNPKIAPTRKGLFSILNKEPNHFSSLSHVWMPWSMQYSGDYFIHEWPYWPGGKRIASKYSAGCLRLNSGDSKELYDWSEIGTPVLVH